MTNRDRVVANERAVRDVEDRALCEQQVAAKGIWTVEDDNVDARLLARGHHVIQRPCVRVESRSNVGNIKEHRVEILQRACRGTHPLSIERDHRQTGGRIDGVCHRHAVGGLTTQPMLWPEQPHKRDPSVKEGNARSHRDVAGESRGIVGYEPHPGSATQFGSVCRKLIDAEANRSIHTTNVALRP